MLFDHDAKVSGDSARFADLPRGRQPRGVRPLGGWRDCPGLLRPGHGAGNLRAEKMRRMRAAGYWPSPTAWAAVPPGHGDHADRGAVLRRPQPALAHIGESRAGRLRSGRLREITDERTISDLVAGACCSRRCFLWHLDGRPDLRLIRACGFCGPMAATCCAPADSARSSTTDRTFMYSLCAPHPPTRRPTDHRSRDPSQRVPVDPVPL